MLSNKHLLAIVAGLGGLSALLGIVLVIFERTNANRIEALTRELGDTQRRHQETQTILTARVTDLSAELTRLRGKAQTTEADLAQTRKVFEDSRASITNLLRKKWLAADDDAPPWDKELKALEKRLETVEAAVKKNDTR